MNTRIQQVLDDKVRPQLALHRGDLELLRVEDGVVVIRLLGQCAVCPSASLTAQEFIFEELARAIPEVKKVVAEQKVSDNLLQQAKDILRRRHE